MLLDAAIRQVTLGQQAMDARQIEKAFNALEKAQRIIVELSKGLNREVNPQLVDQMSALYLFIYRRVVHASLHRDRAALDDALRILRHQRETWEIVVEKVSQARGELAGGNLAAIPPATLNSASGSYGQH
jgi:flagellar protein FliS